MICPRCHVETVGRLPGPTLVPDVELVSMLATGDPGLIAVAQSLLEAKGIDNSCAVRGCRTCSVSAASPDAVMR